jgi:hypothetical protein
MEYDENRKHEAKAQLQVVTDKGFTKERHRLRGDMLIDELQAYLQDETTAIAIRLLGELFNDAGNEMQRLARKALYVVAARDAFAFPEWDNLLTDDILMDRVDAEIIGSTDTLLHKLVYGLIDALGHEADESLWTCLERYTDSPTGEQVIETLRNDAKERVKKKSAESQPKVTEEQATVSMDEYRKAGAQEA